MIVDDEPLAADLLATYVGQVPYLALQHKCHLASDALSFLRDESVDLIFADINMPFINGMEFAKILPREQKVIFTTAYSGYAVESYSVSTIDYLLKPITFERFVQSVDKASRTVLRSSHAVVENISPDSFFVKSGKSMIQIQFRDLLYIEGLKDYVFFTTERERHIVYKRMKDLESMLPSTFIRVQNSFIVNTDHITRIEDNHVFVLNRQIAIGPKYREDFLKRIMTKML
ncbi:LytR/AlgR family response regulator transcription factor [Chryseolinea sp. T2]|uniref:LytR/AlgR family response regulator transcription factor n=1 Tax=Chryseolinea sp. T2 TaxID=3129255 RepID=UPI0030776450